MFRARYLETPGINGVGLNLRSRPKDADLVRIRLASQDLGCCITRTETERTESACYALC